MPTPQSGTTYTGKFNQGRDRGTKTSQMNVCWIKSVLQHEAGRGRSRSSGRCNVQYYPWTLDNDQTTHSVPHSTTIQALYHSRSKVRKTSCQLQLGITDAFSPGQQLSHPRPVTWYVHKPLKFSIISMVQSYQHIVVVSAFWVRPLVWKFEWLKYR